MEKLRNPKNVKTVSLIVAAIFVIGCFTLAMTAGGFGSSVASAAGSDSAIGVVDFQVKGYHTVAAGRIGQIGRIVTGFGVSSAVPSEALACYSRGVAGSGVVDSKVKGYHTVAAGRIGQIGRIIARLDVGGAAPGEALAGNGGRVAGSGMVDCQVQCHN